MGIEFDFAGCAAVGKADSKFFECGPVVYAFVIAFLASNDADSSLQALFHDRVKPVLRCARDSQVRGPQERQDLLTARIVVEQLGRQCLPELSAAHLGKAKVSGKPDINREEDRVVG